ncbi:MAG: prepilin-type N-terminal cleavage/methylation domain-containing protein [Proteobacteria bacterium]|nr:prepilin-type N-terminal cleavage/methylation domain-containing protein [Pseudomonadota bacterium]
MSVWNNQNHRNVDTTRGVTLVELAIAIVIIAVLLMALTAGRNLMRAGKVRAVISETESFRGAFTRFQDKYNELPGDMTEAQSYFGATETHNGNGDETIPWATEGALAWQHLQLASMIGASKMSGTGAAGIVDKNVPASKIAGAGYFVDYDANSIGNHFGIGRADGSGTNDAAALKPEDAFNIDSKMDDGITNKGRIRGLNGSNTTGCAQTLDNTKYDVTKETEECVLLFQLDNQLKPAGDN